MSDDSYDPNRQATRTASANVGDIRYGTRGAAEDVRESRNPYRGFVRAAENQGRVMRNIYRNYRNGSR